MINNYFHFCKKKNVFKKMQLFVAKHTFSLFKFKASNLFCNFYFTNNNSVSIILTQYNEFILQHLATSITTMKNKQIHEIKCQIEILCCLFIRCIHFVRLIELDVVDMPLYTVYAVIAKQERIFHRPT